MTTRRVPRPMGRAALWLAMLLVLGPLVPRFAGAAHCEPSLPVGDERASRILAEERPFAPTDRDLFYSFEHPDWAEAAPPRFADGPESSEEATEDALRALLERRFPCAPGQVRNGLEVYVHPYVRQKVPEPTLRAALAALTGTLGQPAIEFLILRTPVTSIHFGVPIFNGQGLPGGTLAATYGLPDGTLQIVFDRRFRFTHFAAFSALLFHEALHTGLDGDNAGLPEEAVASALEALVYMEMLLVEPDLAELPDSLTRFNNNHLALVRLNSGGPGNDRLTLFVPNGEETIDPLAVEPLTEFYDFYSVFLAPADPEFRERETAGNPLLQAILQTLAEPGNAPPTDADFDRETVEFVDQNQAVLSPAELIAVACILRLDVPCD